MNYYWGAVILDFFKLLQSDDLKPTDYRILFYLLEHMNPLNNQTLTKQKTMANHLGLHKSSVSKTIRRLINEQFIVKIDSGFMINPHLFYVAKSSRSERSNLRSEFDSLLTSEKKFHMDEYMEKRLLNLHNQEDQAIYETLS